MITLFYSKDQLRNFLMSLSQIMAIIKAKTGQIFIPLIIQSNPMNTAYEMMIVMRSMQKKFDKY